MKTSVSQTKTSKKFLLMEWIKWKTNKKKKMS